MKSPQELHNEFVGYRAYCQEFLSHKRRNRFMARWMPTKRVSCPCGCGEFWMDDLSDTNWLTKVLSVKTFVVMAYHLHQVVKGLHGVVWFAFPVYWMHATQSSRDIRLLFYSNDNLERRVPFLQPNLVFDVGYLLLGIVQAGKFRVFGGILCGISYGMGRVILGINTQRRHVIAVCHQSYNRTSGWLFFGGQVVGRRGLRRYRYGFPIPPISS